MTELLTRPIADEAEAIYRASDFAHGDQVRVRFLFRVLERGAKWQDMNYEIGAVIVAGAKPDVPYWMPDRPLPEGEKFNTAHPRELDPTPIPQALPDGTPIEYRYVVTHLALTETE